MDDTETHYCAWQFIDSLPENSLRLIVVNFSDPESAYQATKKQLLELGIKPKACDAWLGFAMNPVTHKAWQTAKFWQQKLADVTVLNWHSEAYPALLREIAKPPALLYVKGDVQLLNKPQLAMVGSRRASAAGLEHAHDFAKALASSGFVVTSGGALGVDAAAHTGALAAGQSIAVIGTGIDRSYPATNTPLFKQLYEYGAVISEFRPGSAPMANHFPRRNRIIAGMTLATIVVEAALKSGSLITAQYALDFNREVFALPGAVNDMRAKGTNALIKQGAKLTETVNDIIEEFDDFSRYVEQKTAQASKLQFSDDAENVLPLVDYAITPIEFIAQRAQRAAHELIPALLELELAGVLQKEHSGYSRIK